MPKFGDRGDGLRPSQTFARRLREIRRDRGLSQADLARLMREHGLPMSKVAVLRIERGERGLSLDEALAFASVLDAAPAHMLSPPEGDYVWPTDQRGHSGAELRNWLLFGDPLLISKEGQRVRARLTAIFPIERLAQAIGDATRGGDRAGVEAAAFELKDVIDKHRTEIEAIERGEKT